MLQKDEKVKQLEQDIKVLEQIKEKMERNFDEKEGESRDMQIRINTLEQTVKQLELKKYMIQTETKRTLTSGNMASMNI